MYTLILTNLLFSIYVYNSLRKHNVLINTIILTGKFIIVSPILVSILLKGLSTLVTDKQLVHKWMIDESINVVWYVYVSLPIGVIIGISGVIVKTCMF